MTLVVIASHPIQYQAPIYKTLHSKLQVPTTVIYGSDFSVRGYDDKEFGTKFAWDVDLLEGYESVFLAQGDNAPASVKEVTADGLAKALKDQNSARAILLLGYHFRFDLKAFWLAKQTGLPLLFRSETTDHARSRTGIKSLLRDNFLKWFYQQFSYMLYIGKNSLQHYKRLGVREERLIFAPYCVNDVAFRLDNESKRQLRKQMREELAISPDKIVILYSGKIVHRKGTDLLINAARNLPETLRNQIVLVFLGDGELRSAMQALVQSSNPKLDARFTGFQNQSKLSQYYYVADMLAVPSRYDETWGLVVNEGLMHGLPVVVSDKVGCAPDLIKPGVTGEVFESESVESMAAALERAYQLVKNPSTQSHCKNLVAGYSVEAAAKGIEQAYRQLPTIVDT